MSIDGITYLRIDEENYISNMEPVEYFYKAHITKNGVNGVGLGETPNAALVDAIDWVESYNLETEKFIGEVGAYFPF